MDSDRTFTMLWRNKFLTTEATSIKEMAKILRESADQLDAMAKAGVVLSDNFGNVGDDYAYLETDDPEVAKQFEMEEAIFDDEADEDDLVEEAN